MTKVSTETTISVSADDIANILRDYFNVPNAKVSFVLGSKSSPSADFRDCQFIKVLSSAELVYQTPVTIKRYSITQSNQADSDIVNDR